jgi:hypothetical protein
VYYDIELCLKKCFNQPSLLVQSKYNEPFIPSSSTDNIHSIEQVSLG